MNSIYPVQIGALANNAFNTNATFNGYQTVVPEPTEEERALQKTNEELKAKVAALEEELKGLKKILDD